MKTNLKFYKRQNANKKSGFEYRKSRIEDDGGLTIRIITDCEYYQTPVGKAELIKRRAKQDDK